jgi:hypothetical protein
MAVPGITVRIKETKDVEALLKKLPIEARETGLAKSMRNAATIFANEVRRKAGNLDGSSYDRPAWGSNVTPGALRKGITSPKRIRKNTPAHVIRIRVTTRGVANRYAAMAEYGHEKYIFGHKYAGQNDKKTPPVGFWRSSKDETESSVDRRIKEILKQEITRIINA